MSGPGIPSFVLLLAALSSAAVTDGTAKRDIVKTFQKPSIPKSPIVPNNKDLALQEKKSALSQLPKKRHRRKFDFDAEFASYLGLSSQEDTARYLAGDKDASYRASAGAVQDFPDVHPHRPLRLSPGSTPASFAYFTQIYPDKNSDGDIRIEHFSPIIHPLSSEREKNQYRVNEEESERFEQPRQNDAPLYTPPTSRSYFGRYSNKYPDPSEEDGHKPFGRYSNKYPDPSEEDGHKPFGRYSKYPDPSEEDGHKPFGRYSNKYPDPSEEDGHKSFGRYSNKYPDPSEEDGHKPKYQSSKNYEDDTSPDYKMGYKKFGMYHKFHEEDLYPKKTSSEWIPLQKFSKTNQHKPEGYKDERVSSEDFHATSENDDEVRQIKSNIDNDPPYSTSNFDIDETGELKTKAVKLKEDDRFTSEAQPVRRHKKRRKNRRKHRRPNHQQGRPVFRSSPNGEYKTPSFEFHNPVSDYESPYNPPESNKKLEAEPFKNLQESGESPSEPFQSGPDEDISTSVEADKDNSLEVPSDTSDEPADVDVDYGPAQLDDLDKDYHIIREAGPREHAERTKDFDQRLPEPDEKVYGSFETFDSQLDSKSKKFEPFVQYPFDEQRQKLKTDVDELIERGKSR